jgi:hypothetical protein
LLSVDVLFAPDKGSPKFQSMPVNEYPDAAQLVREKLLIVGGAVNEPV